MQKILVKITIHNLNIYVFVLENLEVLNSPYSIVHGVFTRSSVLIRGKIPSRAPKKIIVPVRNPKVTEGKFKKTHESEIVFSGSSGFLSGLGSKSPTTDSGNMEFRSNISNFFVFSKNLVRMIIYPNPDPRL